jgi:molybdate transport system permease protein
VTRGLPGPLPWLAALLSVYLFGPLLAAIPQIWSSDWQSVDLDALGRASAVSVASATMASALIALGGIPLGYLLARASSRGAAALGFLVQLPLALPPLASGILLLFLLGHRSILGRLTGGGLTDSFTGIVLAEIFVAAPFLIIAARSAFAAVDPVLEGVAASLGHHRLAIFFRISLPLAWPAARSGLLLAWLRAFGEFGATVMVAYHPYSLPVYTYVTFGSEGLPAMLPVLLPALAAALIVMGLAGAGTRRIWNRNRSGAVRSAPGLVQTLDESSRHRPLQIDALPPLELMFQFQKQYVGFVLDVAWSGRSRRLAILGPSGSGKSLTLRLIAGLERPDQDTLKLGSRDLAQLPPDQRGIAYVPQNYGLFPHLTVAEHLNFPIGARPEMAKHWLRRLSLGGLEDRLPPQLSLGQQQRVALARALVRPADLILLDEPLSALDAPLRSRLRRELRELQREIAATTIIVTHDPEEAALLADEIIVLGNGGVLQASPVQAVFSRPASETVARLLGAENVGEGVATSENQIAIEGGVILTVAGPPLQSGRRAGWSVRPERARLSAEGRYEVMVEGIETIGNTGEVFVRLGSTPLRILTDPGSVTQGSIYRLDIDPGSIQVWQ